jgi:hypothetical protein
MLCGLPADDPRAGAARGWLARHFAAGEHPGAYAPDRQAARAAVYFYYCHSLCDALAMDDADRDFGGRQKSELAQALAAALVARQRPDGSWRNAAVDVREDDPLIATSLAAGALARCRAILSRPDAAGLQPARRLPPSVEAAESGATPERWR